MYIVLQESQGGLYIQKQATYVFYSVITWNGLNENKSKHILCSHTSHSALIGVLHLIYRCRNNSETFTDFIQSHPNINLNEKENNKNIKVDILYSDNRYLKSMNFKAAQYVSDKLYTRYSVNVENKDASSVWWRQNIISRLLHSTVVFS